MPNGKYLNAFVPSGVIDIWNIDIENKHFQINAVNLHSPDLVFEDRPKNELAPFAPGQTGWFEGKSGTEERYYRITKS